MCFLRSWNGTPELVDGTVRRLEKVAETLNMGPGLELLHRDGLRIHAFTLSIYRIQYGL